MTDDDVLNYFRKYKIVKSISIDNAPNDIKSYLYNRFDDSESIYETYVRLKEGVFIRPVCKRCGGKVKYKGTHHTVIGKRYLIYCCKECEREDMKIRLPKICIDGMLKKYNVPHALLLKEFVDKAKRTKKEKYGNEKYTNHKQTILTKLIRYGDMNYNNRHKFKSTCLDKFGVDNPAKDKTVHEKMITTLNMNYDSNVTNPSQIKEIQDKRLDTFNVKYDVDNPSQLDFVKKKKEETSLKNFGVKHWMRSNDPEILEKIIKCIVAGFNSYEENGKMRSRPEKETYEEILKVFPDAEKQYNDKRYKKYICDIYIPSKDLFIECHYGPKHHNYPFDENNPSHWEEVNILLDKASKSRNRFNNFNLEKMVFYESVIWTWTHSDVEKVKLSKEYNFKLLTFYTKDEAMKWLSQYM